VDELSSLVSLCGASDALRVARDAEAAIREIETLSAGRTASTRIFASRFALDGHVELADGLLGERAGSLREARRRAVPQAPARGDRPANRLSRPPRGILDPTAATVHPARLVRGLRKVALESGVRIYENTRIRSFSRGRPVVLRADRGTLTAKRLVIAANAWAAGIPELSRAIVAITSDMVMSAPAPDRLAQIGWTGGSALPTRR
jgi:glycine/D-amino acid oxidase-like deaminating enzyme